MSTPSLLTAQYQFGDNGVLLNDDVNGGINYALNSNQVASGSTDECLTRFTWTRSFVTNVTDHPKGITTAVKFTSAETGTGTGRGSDWYGNSDTAAGTSGSWLDQPCTPGETIYLEDDVKFSLTNYASMGINLLIAFHDGAGNYVSSRVYGDTVVNVKNTWSTVSVAQVVPAGAKYFVAAVRTSPSATFTTSDTFYQTNVRIMRLGFFDVTSVQGLDSAPVRSVVSPREGQDGSWIDAQYKTERTVVIEGNAYANPFGVDRYIQKLKANYKASKDVMPFYFGTNFGVRMVRGKSLGFNYTQDSNRRIGVIAGQMQITCPDPRIYTADPQVITSTSANSSHGFSPTTIDGGTTTAHWYSTITGVDNSHNQTNPTVSVVSGRTAVSLTYPGVDFTSPSINSDPPYQMDVIWVNESGWVGDDPPIYHCGYFLKFDAKITCAGYLTLTYYIDDEIVQPVYTNITSTPSPPDGFGTNVFTTSSTFFIESQYIKKLRVVIEEGGGNATITATNLLVTSGSVYFFNSGTPSVSYYVDMPVTLGGDTEADYQISISTSLGGLTSYLAQPVLVVLDASGNIVSMQNYQINLSTSSSMPYVTYDTYAHTATQYAQGSGATYPNNSSSNPWAALPPGSYTFRLYNGPNDISNTFTLTVWDAWE